ncbi:MAG: hypothetical protein NTX45_06910 [Proteobacteria bacterium]|nr:hypothetical protein [Pseudomonadota bacterium]
MGSHTQNVGNGVVNPVALRYIGEPSTPPKISQAHDPPLWDTGEAAQREVFDAGPDLGYGAADRP